MGNRKSRFSWESMKKSLMTFHLPIILILAIVIGIVYPVPGILTYPLLILGKILAKTIFSKVCVFCIFLISGLKLDVSSVKNAMKYWPVLLCLWFLLLAFYRRSRFHSDDHSFDRIFGLINSA